MEYILIIIYIFSLLFTLSALKNCSTNYDCFNCTLTIGCQWSNLNNTCIPYYGKNIIPKINATKNITNYTILYQHISYIREACFPPIVPYIPTNISYNLLSEFYYGKKHVCYNDNNFSTPIEITLNKINNRYGTPNILCQYDILTGGVNPYALNIEVNKNLTDQFLLIFLNDTESVGAVINKTQILNIKRPGVITNSFIYLGYSSFDSLPFRIYLKMEKGSMLLSYLYLSMIILGVVTVFVGVIYVRCFSTKLKKNGKSNNPEEMRLNENDENILDKKNENKKGDNKLTIINEKGEEMECTGINEET